MKKLIFVLLLLLPSVTFAANFATDPLFLSRTPVTEGQTVRVYAVIENNDANSFSGLLIFYDGNTRIGSSTINLAAGATQTASILWTPAAGPHPINASLVATDGTITQQVAVTFTINAKPQPAANTQASAQSAASIDSSAAIQKDIAGVSPQVAGAAVPAFSAIDSARNSFANILDGQIATAKQKIAANPKTTIVGGSATQDATIQNPTTGVWYWVYTIYLYILQALRWLVGNAGVFYPFIALLFLYLLYRLYRRYRRP